MMNLKPYPRMKDSGVPWLGDVPEHWDVLRNRVVTHLLVSNVDKHIKEGEVPVRLCNYVNVYKNDKINTKLHFMRATASVEEATHFKLLPGDVIITKDSESWTDIGVPALVEESANDLVCGYHLAILRPDVKRIHGAFLFRAVQSLPVAYQFHIVAKGVTRYGLSHDSIKSIWIATPPPEEQSAIVRFLDHMDARIRKYIRAKQKLIKLLEEQKQAIIHQAVTRGLDRDVRLKPSGVEWLGEIPEHWSMVPSKRLFAQRQDLATPEDIQLSATQAYGVIPQAEYEEKVGRRVVKIFKHLEKRKHVDRDDFVISMRSFQGGLERAWASGAIRSSYVVLRPLQQVDVEFFSYLLKSPAYIKALQSVAGFIRDGQDLTYADFSSVPLPLIPQDEQKLIATRLNKAIGATEETLGRSRNEIHFLSEYRIRLISDVVTGKLDVREAAKKLPDALEEVVPDIEELSGEELGEAVDEEGLEAEPEEVEA